MAEYPIFNILRLFLAGSLVACGPIPVRPAPVPTALPLAPAGSSCVVNSPQRQPIDVRKVEWIGRAGDRTWVLAKSGAHRVLLHLTGEKVEPFVLPDAFDTGFVSVHVREHFLWVLRTGTNKPISGAAWVLVDVRSPDKPQLNRIELLDPVPADAPNRFAVWADRALFFLGSPGEFAMWSLTTRLPLGARVGPDAKASDVPWLHCSEAICLSIMPEGLEDKRHMALRRIDKKGVGTKENIGPGVVAESMNFLWNDRIITAWSRFDAKGLWARQIDAKSGGFNGATYAVSGVEPDIQDPQAIHSRNGLWLAWQAARVGWRLGKLDDDGIAVTDVFTLPAPGSFLSAATTDDGIVAAIYSADQDEERGKKEWYSSVRALFIPFGKTPTESDVVTLANDEHGHGGIGGYALAAPNAAAILVTPEDNAQGESFVMMLRKPCAKK